MPKHKLSPYKVGLRQEHKTGAEVRTQDYWELDNLGSMNPGLKGYDNFIELMEDFLTHIRDKGYINDVVKRAITSTQFESGSGNFSSNAEARTIEAELTYGRYDRVADHTDKSAFESATDSPFTNRRENQRDRDTVAETRLHFLAHVPTNTNRHAFFVLHSYGRNSMKLRLQDALNRFIQSKYDSSSTPFAMEADRRKSGFKLDMNTVAGPDLVDKLRSAKIAGFEVRKRNTNVPEYMSDSTTLRNDAKGDLTIQFTSDNIFADLSTKKEALWERIRNEKYPLAELVDNNPNKVNALVESDDGLRRINISREEVRMEEIIPESELEYDSQGRVKISKIGSLSRIHLNKKLKDIGAIELKKDSLL